MPTHETTDQPHDAAGLPPPPPAGPPPDAPRSPPAVVPAARVTVTGTVIWQPTGGQAQDVVPFRDSAYTRLLHADEQPWRRDTSVGLDWAPLDLGWLADLPHPPSLLSVVNREGHFSGGIPTSEVRAAVLARVVEVGVDVSVAGLTNPDRHPFVIPFARVRPYESCRFEPTPQTRYVVRCPRGPAKVTVAAVPGDGT
jgi:hypothetical protein